MDKVVFFGSSHHCLVTLEALDSDAQFELVAVVTQPPKPVGRKQVLTPTAVETWAVEHGIEVIKPASWKKDVSSAERQQLTELGATVGVLSNYGKILPQSVIDIFLKGIVNIHPSLLPKYRGPAPAVGVILNGEKISGTSIMLLSAEMDAGPVLGTVEFAVADQEIPETYYEKGFGLGTQKLMELLPKYLDGALQLTEQDDVQATYTKMLKKEDGKIDWTKSTEEIERMVRAYTPWPGTWTEVFIEEDGNQIIINSAMATKIGLEQQDLRKDLTTTPQVTKRLKVLKGYTEAGLFVPEEVQLEGATVSLWEKFKVNLS